MYMVVACIFMNTQTCAESGSCIYHSMHASVSIRQLSSIEVHTIPPTADYDNFHPSTTTLQIQDCSAYGVVTSRQ